MKEYAKLNFKGKVPSETNRLMVAILHTLVDRYEGLSETYEVYGAAPNDKFLAKALANVEVRKTVSAYFTRRQSGVVMRGMIASQSVKPSERPFTVAGVVSAISSAVSNVEAAGVICELTIPLMRKLDMLSDSLRFSKHVRYGFGRVTIEDIGHDVAVYAVMKAVTASREAKIDKNQKYSRDSFAEIFANALYGIGVALMEVDDYSIIIDDMVKGVRAHIDPTLSEGQLTGSCPVSWSQHPVIAEAAQNMIFVEAALNMAPGSSVQPLSEAWKRDQMVNPVMAAIKSSERYAWVGKSEITRHIGLRKVRDNRGAVKSAVLFRLGQVMPVAQSVFQFSDLMYPDLVSIAPTKDRLAESIKLAYGSANFSTDIGAGLVDTVLTHAIESGWRGFAPLYVVDWEHEGKDVDLSTVEKVDDGGVKTTIEGRTIGAGGIDLTMLAVMLSSRIYIGMDPIDSRTGEAVLPDADAKTEDLYFRQRWWFVAATRELNLDVWSGTHNRTEVVTCDPVEVMLAADAFEPADAFPTRPQVLGASAFSSYLIGFDDDILTPVDARYSFDITINNVQVRGAFKPYNFATLRAGSASSSIVKPHYNEAIIFGLQRSFAMVTKMIKKMRTSKDQWRTDGQPGDMLFDAFEGHQARILLDLAKQIAPDFRHSVHDAMVEKTLATEGNAKLSMEESDLLRAQLSRASFKACADVIALDFFLHMQGIKSDAFRELFKSPAMVRHWLQIGSEDKAQ